MRRASKRVSKSVKYDDKNSSDSSDDDDEPVIKLKKKVAKKITTKNSTNIDSQNVVEISNHQDESSSDSSVGGNFKTSDKIDSIKIFEETTNVINVKKDSRIDSKLLSDSEDSDLEDVQSTEDKDNQARDEIFQQIENYQKKYEDAKQKLMNYSKKLTPNEQLLDIKEILKMGETTGNESQNQIFESDNEVDSEFEEVEHVIDKPSTSTTGLQITIEVPNLQSTSKTKKEVDMMAVIKRKINRVKKEYQVYIHRVHLLCWIGHGNYLNSILNNVNLLALALSLIPSENCYPDGRLTLAYIEQITTWYSKIFKLKPEVENRTIEDILTDLPLDKALQLEMAKKEATSRKNYVLIFICMLRALNVQCRLVLSLRVVPLQPPQSELCSLSTKKAELPKKTENKEFKKLNTALKDLNSKKRIKSNNLLGCAKKSIFFDKKSKSAKKLKIPQVDGANDILPNVSNKRQIKSVKNPANQKPAIKSSIKIKVNDQDLSSGDEYFQVEKTVANVPRSKSISAVPKRVRKTPEKKIVVIPRSKSAPETSEKQIKPQEKLIKLKGKSPSLTSKKSTQKSLTNEEKLLKAQGIKTRGKSPSVTPKKPTIKSITNEDKLLKIQGIKSRGKSISDAPKTAKARSKSVPKKTVSKKPLTGEEKLLKAQGIKHRSKSASNLKSPFFENGPSSSVRSPVKTRGNVVNPKLKNAIVDIVKGLINEERGKANNRAVKIRKSPDPSSDDGSEYLSETSIPKKKRKSSTDDEFDIKTKNKMKSKVTQLRKSIDRRVLSTDDDDDKKKKKLGNDVWVEIFVEEEEKWISVDVIKGKVHCVQELHSRATQPVVYTVAWNNNGTLKDVTSRYSKNWNTVTRKLRDDPVWWKKTLKPYEETKTACEKEEDEELARQQLDQPLPTAISEYKNHPLYALKRHLLKFEAIYPADSPTLGFVRKEPVYARECVHTLHSRETWVKQARVVKPYEQPYKIVKARPKYDRTTGTVTTDIPLEIFGYWQTKEYEPPVAENGVVPRNAYGNVELFKMCMLPIGTVHLQLPSLNKVAKKLGIDCAPAVVGFDFHSGSCHPTFDGFVVCEEFKDTLLAAWEQDQIETEKRAREKIEKRVYGNWRRIIKGLFIRERLQERYDFGNDKTTTTASGSTKKKSSLKVTERKRRICSDDDSGDSNK